MKRRLAHTLTQETRDTDMTSLYMVMLAYTGIHARRMELDISCFNIIGTYVQKKRCKSRNRVERASYPKRIIHNSQNSPLYSCQILFVVERLYPLPSSWSIEKAAIYAPAQIRPRQLRRASSCIRELED
jgi:hypothetical protein